MNGPESPESPTTGTDEDTILTEDSIKAMDFDQLSALLKANDVEVPEHLTTREKLAAWVIEQFSS